MFVGYGLAVTSKTEEFWTNPILMNLLILKDYADFYV